MATFNRRAFLRNIGVATGTAVISARPAAAAAAEPVVETRASGPIPQEPIVVVVRDRGRGEVTVLSGKTEKTYRDRALVRRLVKVAEQNHQPAPSANGVA